MVWWGRGLQALTSGRIVAPLFGRPAQRGNGDARSIIQNETLSFDLNDYKFARVLYAFGLRQCASRYTGSRFASEWTDIRQDGKEKPR